MLSNPPNAIQSLFSCFNSKPEKRTVLVITLIALGALIALVGCGIGMTSLLHPNGLGLPSSLQFLKPVICLIGSTPGQWGPLVLTICSGIVSSGVIIAAFYLLLKTKKNDREGKHIANQQTIDTSGVQDVNLTTSEPSLPIPNELVRLRELSNQYIPLMSMAKMMAPRARPPLEIPLIEFSEEEKGRMDEATKRVAQLEMSLKNKYAHEFNNHPWHGWQSFQRILFQDEEFLEAIKDPLVLKIILDNSKKGSELRLSNHAPITISGLLMFGLKGNGIFYLASATPSWQSVPVCIKDYPWKYDGNLGLKGNEPKDDGKNLREITDSYLLKLSEALDTIHKTFASLLKIEDSSLLLKDESTLSPYIVQLGVVELLHLYSAVIDTKSKADLITTVPAAPSSLETMAEECFAVMAVYDQILANHEGNHLKALSYGLVSHVLDARHLAAAIYFLDKPFDRGNTNQQKAHFKKGHQATIQFFEDLRNGSLSSAVTCLIAGRLQQMVEQMIEPEKPLMLGSDKDKGKSSYEEDNRRIIEGVRNWILRD